MHTETVVEIGDEYGSEFKGRYVFQEITWAKRSRIIQKHTRYSPLTGQMIGSDNVAIQAELVMASLKEQPEHKPITLERLLSEDSEKGVPIGLGELFSQVVNRLNCITVEEQRFLSAKSAEANLTQPSLSSASARSSAGQLQSSGGSQQEQSSSSS